MVETARHYIGGEWVSGEGLALGENVNPANGERSSSYVEGTQPLTSQAIDAAYDAFHKSDWAQSPRLRAKVLYEFADRLEASKPRLTEIISAENGKLRREAAHEIDAGVSEARYYAGLARNIFGRTTETAPGAVSYLTREPLGVAAVITPWNAPITLLVRSLAPALAAGCTSIIKPAQQTSLSNDVAVKCFAEIEGLPAGVVNAVNGDRVHVGGPLVASPKVDVVSFTGSSAGGKAIMAAGSETMKRMSLELGGKAPAILFPDADMTKAVADITRCALVHAGQMCVAITRILVHKDCYREFRDRFTEAFQSYRTGDPQQEASQMGPVIDRANQERLCNVIERADEEADLLVRGGRPGGDLANGSYVTPTLFAIEDVGASLVQDELFGPIVGFEIFEDEEDAVTKANATRFGLAASVWTQDVRRAMRMARALRSGTVWLNSHMKLMAEAETGGFGESGLGRLHGEEGLAEFLETKHVYLEAI